MSTVKFKLGEEVIFNCSFENANTRIECGDKGIIKSIPGGCSLNYYYVVARRIGWMVKPNEIRPASKRFHQG